jgi:hypothetical protein
MIRHLCRLLPALPLLAAGCAGSSYTGFVTTENLGIHVESSPQPYVSIGTGRSEGAIAPVFADGRTSALLAASFHDSTSLLPLSWNHGSVFAGGAAAALAARDPARNTPAQAVADADDARERRTIGAACIASRPKGWDNAMLPEEGMSRPMLFGTTTSIGFRVSLPATAAAGGAFPDAHLGYRRHEAAYAPLLGRPGGCETPDKQPGYQINSPPFIAASKAAFTRLSKVASTFARPRRWILWANSWMKMHSVEYGSPS